MAHAVGAVAEGFGLLTIVPLAAIAIDGGELDDRPLSRPWISEWTVDERLLVTLALFVAAMAARSILLFARDILLARLQSEYEAGLRLRAAATLARRGWPFASRIGQSGMQSLLLNQVPRAGEAASFAAEMAIGVIMLLVQLAITFYLSPGLTLVALGFLAAGSFLSLRFTRRGVRSGLVIVDAVEDSAGSGSGSTPASRPRSRKGRSPRSSKNIVPAFTALQASSRNSLATTVSLGRSPGSVRRWSPPCSCSSAFACSRCLSPSSSQAWSCSRG